MSSAEAEKVFRAFGLERLSERVDGIQLLRRRASCQCGAHCSVAYKTKAPPAQVVQQFEAKGWERKGAKWKCPACAGARKTDSATIHQIHQIPEAIPVAVPVKGAPETAAPTIGEIVKVVEMLDRHFDDGRYRDGWSDRKISESLAIPMAKVIAIREQSPNHGPIKEDPEISAIRSELEAMASMLEGLQAALGKAGTTNEGAVMDYSGLPLDGWMAAWTPKGVGRRDGGAVKVGPWPDVTRWSDRYLMTDGCCMMKFHDLDKNSQIALMFIVFHTMVVGCGIDPQAAHKAFLAINEYRYRIAPDIEGAAP